MPRSEATIELSRPSNEDDITSNPVLHYGPERNTPHAWVRDYMTTRGIANADEAPPPFEEERTEVSVVRHVNLHIEENTARHRTDDFACTSARKLNDADIPAQLVVRRGDSVQLSVEFDRPYNKDKHNLKLRFSLGKKPAFTNGSLVELEIEESGLETIQPDEWRATLQEKTGNEIKTLIHIPANCIVGEWNFSIFETLNIGKDDDGKDSILKFQYDHMSDLIVLFNPWCKDDGVYVEKEELLNEYILNASGCLFRGDIYDIDAKDWNYGQFEEMILDSAMYLLRKGFEDDDIISMSDPVKVSRKIAQWVNAPDDNGVLVGKWSSDGTYHGGTSPLKWAGSVKILQQWYETGRPVKYGQCWVFSGITTTVCRALGIPCRSVTNFASAHDTDGSFRIEEYYRNGKPLYTSDSVWNFHVWNEAWMTRPDLPDFPHGWQVIDATPQEVSELSPSTSVFTCGPCPVLAVRKGDVEVNYDAAFVFAEVNSDIVKWDKLPDGSLKLIKVKTNHVGQRISTKTPTGEPFKNDTFGKERWRFDLEAYIEERRLDLTLDYKPKEGSEEERETVERAHRSAKPTSRALDKAYKEELEPKSVKFRLKHSHKTMIGSDLTIELTAKNNGKHDRNISDLGIVVATKTYTGLTGNVFFDEQYAETTVKSGEEIVCCKAVLKPEMYLPHLMELANVRVLSTAKADAVADEKEQRTGKTHNVQFKRPAIDVDCPTLVKKGDKIKFDIRFTNPLDIELTKCDISMECNGIESFLDKKIPNITPKGEYKDTFTLEAVRTRRHAAMFSFDCNELKDISGSATLYIEPKL